MKHVYRNYTIENGLGMYWEGVDYYVVHRDPDDGEPSIAIVKTLEEAKTEVDEHIALHGNFGDEE